MLLFFCQMFLMCARARVYVCVYVCVVHWHCTAQLSMFNMEKRFRNKIIIIIIIILFFLFLILCLALLLFRNTCSNCRSSVHLAVLDMCYVMWM